MTAERRETVLTFGVIVALLGMLLWPERGYVPIWDGNVYANCIVDAATTHGFDLNSLRCARHPTYGWAAILTLSQLSSPGDTGMMLLMNVLLGLLALVSFRALASALFPGDGHARALNVLTVACALHPVLLSTLLQVNPDFGLYVFFLAMYAALVHDRYGWAAVAGTFLAFSKETGAFAAGALVAVEVGRRVLAPALRGMSLRARLARIAPIWPAFLPLTLFGLYLVWWTASANAQPAIWKHDWNTSTADAFRFFDLTDPIFVSYAAGIFVLGFSWVVSAIIAGDALVGGYRFLRRRAPRMLAGADPSLVVSLAVLTLVLTYVLTAFRTWSNVRYFAVLYPLFLLLAYAALVRLRVSVVGRIAAGLVLVGLFGLGAVRSADPVSKAVYGTFSIGDREMYTMTSITGEFSGPGRDELVYNLEFTGFHHIQNALFRELRIGDATWVAISRSMRWHLWSQLDARTRRRTLQRTNLIVPRYADEIDLQVNPNRPTDVVFLEFSNHQYGDHALESLTRRYYREAGIARIHLNGHLLVAHHLVLRALP
ncbi:MAG: hypothetical protein NTU67_13190 [Gemmatimonadetes bacterium]|nr:hypothetical protein [Gemmatimonadota bacterium]